METLLWYLFWGEQVIITFYFISYSDILVLIENANKSKRMDHKKSYLRVCISIEYLSWNKLHIHNFLEILKELWMPFLFNCNSFWWIYTVLRSSTHMEGVIYFSFIQFITLPTFFSSDSDWLELSWACKFCPFTVGLVNATIIKLKIKALTEKINAHNVRCIMSTIKLCIACWNRTYFISKSWNILFYSLHGIPSWFYLFCELHLMIHNKTVINCQIQKDILFYYR